MNNIEKAMQDFRAEQERRVDGARKPLIAFLRKNGIRTVYVYFDGSGDSGQIESIACDPDKGNWLEECEEVPGSEREVATWVSGEPKRAVRACAMRELVEEACYGILGSEHPGWEINEGAFGDFVIDVENDRISLNFNQRIEAVESYEEEY